MPTPNTSSTTPAHHGPSVAPGAPTPYPAGPETTAPATQGPRRRSGRSRLAVVGIAAVAALLDWVILVPVAGLTLTARQGGVQHVGAPAVVISTIVVAFAGWALLSILERRTPRARDIWTVVATIVCVTSLGSPLTNGIGTGAKLGLASLHLVVGVIVILGLRRTALSPAERC